MVSKRVIFTLLFDRGFFMLSRNFRLQKVGDLAWLTKNYDFARTASQIDELVVINVERNPKDQVSFIDHLRELCNFCFVPITAGGGIRSADDASRLLSNGADKVLINTMAVRDESQLLRIAERYGRQSVVLGIDVRRYEAERRALTNYGEIVVQRDIRRHFDDLRRLPVGEWMVTSIDRDGTGQGFEVDLLDLLPEGFDKPLILSGGASKPEHFVSTFSDPRVSALSTAHLFNFVGDGLEKVRTALLHAGNDLPRWHADEILQLRGTVLES